MAEKLTLKALMEKTTASLKTNQNKYAEMAKTRGLKGNLNEILDYLRGHAEALAEKNVAEKLGTLSGILSKRNEAQLKMTLAAIMEEIEAVKPAPQEDEAMSQADIERLISQGLGDSPAKEPDLPSGKMGQDDIEALIAQSLGSGPAKPKPAVSAPAKAPAPPTGKIGQDEIEAMLSQQSIAEEKIPGEGPLDQNALEELISGGKSEEDMVKPITQSGIEQLIRDQASEPSVEKQEEDTLGDDAIANLLGKTPPPASPKKEPVRDTPSSAKLMAETVAKSRSEIEEMLEKSAREKEAREKGSRQLKKEDPDLTALLAKLGGSGPAKVSLDNDVTEEPAPPAEVKKEAQKINMAEFMRQPSAKKVSPSPSATFEEDDSRPTVSSVNEDTEQTDLEQVESDSKTEIPVTDEALQFTEQILSESNNGPVFENPEEDSAPAPTKAPSRQKIADLIEPMEVTVPASLMSEDAEEERVVWQKYRLYVRDKEGLRFLAETSSEDTIRQELQKALGKYPQRNVILKRLVRREIVTIREDEFEVPIKITVSF